MQNSQNGRFQFQQTMAYSESQFPATVEENNTVKSGILPRNTGPDDPQRIFLIDTNTVMKDE
jgi:hypothetical protein